MTTALLDHVRYSDSMDATLARVRRHLAEAIAEAEADGDMPTDAETLGRVGELVEAITQVVLDRPISHEHFAFGDSGEFAVTLTAAGRTVLIRQNADRLLDIAIKDRQLGKTTSALSDLRLDEGLQVVRTAFVG